VIARSIVPFPSEAPIMPDAVRDRCRAAACWPAGGSARRGRRSIGGEALLVHPIDALVLVLAGFGAGLCGSVAGLASLVSYPALLALGIPPVSANVTNTVALVFNSVGSVAGSRPELDGQQARARVLTFVALGGGLTGALLLLATPPGEFTRIVPWLIGLGSLAILARRPSSLAAPLLGGRAAPRRLIAGVFGVAVYAGFFGAGAGVIVLSLLLWLSAESLPRAAALKNLLMGVANLVAAVTFAAFGSVRWWAVLPLALGCLAGGRLGPIVIRHAPDRLLRAVIALAGLGLAVHLGLAAYR
jgi:uncharacterized membrane protein YfcA